MRIGANTPYDWDPARADEALGLLRMLGADELTLMSHTPADLWERLMAELRVALWHVRLKGSRGWWPGGDLGAREWADERSAGESIEWLLGKGVTPHVLLYNEPDIELPPDGMEGDRWASDVPERREEAWQRYRDAAVVAISAIRGQWGERVKVALAPLSQGNDERFLWWAARYVGSGLLGSCDFVGEHCYTDGRPHDDLAWGGRFHRWGSRAPGKPVHLTEFNDNGAFFAADPGERAEDFARYAGYVSGFAPVECLSLFTLPGGKGDADKPSWWWATPVVAEAVRATVPPSGVSFEPLVFDPIPRETGPKADPWQFFTPWQIAALNKGKTIPLRRNVEKVWPCVVDALARRGINTRSVQVAMLATIDVETLSDPPFWPVKEIGEGGRRYVTPNGNYFGRGLIQTTWESNYRAQGQRLGVDLLANPDLLLDPYWAAEAAADYFLHHQRSDGVNCAIAAEMNTSEGWREVRRLVNGGTNGLDRFLEVVNDYLLLGVQAYPTLTYDSAGEPELQDGNWQCSMASLCWALRSVGVGQWGEQELVAHLGPGVVNPDVGLVWGDARDLERFLRGELQLPAFRKSGLGWFQALALAGSRPLLIAGAAWNHWTAVRRSDVGVDEEDGLFLANPAPNWQGVGQFMNRAEWDGWGPWTGIWIDISATEAPTRPTPSPEREPAPDRRLAELESTLGYVTGDVAVALGTARQQFGIATVNARTKKPEVVGQLRRLDEAVSAVEATLRRLRP